MLRAFLTVLLLATLAGAETLPIEQLDVKKHATPGRITIFHFDSGMCGFCPFTSASLQKLCGENPHYVYRHVDMGEPNNELALKYGVKGIFGFFIVDEYGQKLASGKKAYAYVERLYGRTKTPDPKGHFQNG